MASPASSGLQEEPSSDTTALDRVITHLLAAKRSLACVEYVQHANDLVTQTKHALECQTIMSARTMFLQHESRSQMAILDTVREEVGGVADEAKRELDDVLASLDMAEARLKDTLDLLRATMVEAALRPLGEEPKSLADFIEESNVQELVDSIKGSIDSTTEARLEYEKTLVELDKEIDGVRQLMPSPKSSGFTTTLRSPVPDLLQTMTEYAQDMADNLESLVSHFDHCVTAIKHLTSTSTSLSTQHLPLDLPSTLASHRPQSRPPTPPALPDLLHIIENDVPEVDGVVADLHARHMDLEGLYSESSTHTTYLASQHSLAVQVATLLASLASRLPMHTSAMHAFHTQHAASLALAPPLLDQLASVQAFYADFAAAYDELLVEAGRRARATAKAERLRDETLARFSRWAEDEQREREAFANDVGAFLPVDLWAASTAEVPHWEVVRLGEEADSTVPAEVVRTAMRRVSARLEEAKKVERREPPSRSG